MNPIIQAVLVYIGRKIVEAIAFIEAVSWAALSGLATGGSSAWDLWKNYEGPLDWQHITRVALPPMAASVGQWIYMQNKIKVLKLEHELELVRASMKGEPQ